MFSLMKSAVSRSCAHFVETAVERQLARTKEASFSPGLPMDCLCHLLLRGFEKHRLGKVDSSHDEMVLLP